MTGEHQPPKHGIARAAGTLGIRKAAASVGSAVVSTLGWPVILGVTAVVIVAAALAAIAVFAAFASMKNERAQFLYQCESRLGHSVGNTASKAVVPRIATSVAFSDTPTWTWQTTLLQPATTTASLSGNHRHHNTSNDDHGANGCDNDPGEPLCHAQRPR